MSSNNFVALVVLALISSACAPTRGSSMQQSYDKATEYYSKALYSDAERELLKLSKAMPSNYDVFFKLGNIYVRTGQLQAAERMYQRCIDIDPNQPKGWYNMSLLRVKQALYLAEEGASRSVKTEPKFATDFTQLKDGLMSTLREQ